MSVRWGLMSTARINGEIVAAARKSSALEVLGVASRDGVRATQYARANGITRAYGSYEEMLEDRDIEAVYISLPNSLHVPWSIRALEAGKHVLCEKPLSSRPDEAEEAFALAERRRLVLSEGFMYRHHPQTRKVAALVREGAIGRLVHLRAAFSFPLADPANIRLSADLAGGSLMDLGCYCASGMRLLAGEPRRAYGERVDARTGVDLAFYGTLRFTGGVVGQFDCSFAAPRRQDLEVVGEEGVLHVSAPWRIDWGGDVMLRRGERVEEIVLEKADAYQLELENVSAAIRGDGSTLLGRADAVGQAAVLEALYRSAASGRPVDLTAPD